MSRQFLHRLQARVYAGSWKNPLFADPKVKERSSNRLQFLLYALLTGASVSAICAVLFWFATQPRFSITTIEVVGMRSIPNTAVALSAWEATLACDYFFVPCFYSWNSAHASLEETLHLRYPISHLQASTADHILTLHVEEAVVMIPLRIEQQVWFATQQGVLQYEASEEDIHAGMIIPPEAYTEIDISALVQSGDYGQQIADSELFISLANYKKELLAQGIPIVSFLLTNDPGKVIAQTQAGFAIYFTPWEDARKQAQRLASVLVQQVPNEYADIRFGERVYIK